MQKQNKINATNTALIICFTALYVILSFLPLSQVLGLFGKYITVATIFAPIIGIILGLYVGVLSTLLGGIVALFFNPSFSPPSLAAGIVTALCAGLLYAGKRKLCILTYAAFLLIFGFYPFVGPFWLYPISAWFQIAGLLILISPLQSKAIKNLGSNNNSWLLFAFFITSLTSTLAGQIAGSLVFTALIPDMTFLSAYWQVLTFLYPVERTLIALVATFVGAALYKVLESASLTEVLNRANRLGRPP